MKPSYCQGVFGTNIFHECVLVVWREDKLKIQTVPVK
jgi:hypothetical protein